MQRQPKSITTANYQIVLQGKIPTFREEWFERMAIHYDQNGNSVLFGEGFDQAALHGILDKISDLGLILISVMKVESKP